MEYLSVLNDLLLARYLAHLGLRADLLDGSVSANASFLLVPNGGC